MINEIQSALIAILFLLFGANITVTIIIGKMIWKEAKKCREIIEETEKRGY